MATRTERVRLELEDHFTAGMARAAAAAKLLDKSLDELDGTNTRASRSTRDLGDDVDRSSTSFKRGESSLNQFTGRLATMARAAALVGPAVVPLTAGMVPALAAMTAGLSAAAGALGVTLLAANGLGDGLKALNAYQLEPTAANAVKLQQEFEKLGPSGEQFVRYLDSLGPQLKSIQFAARDGLFPGVEDGIDALLTRLPQVRRIVSEIAETMGDLAGDAGAGLAGGGFDDFFEYLDNEAGPILRAFGETAGNVFETFANLIVGVDPLTQSFTDGMVRQSEALAEWSRGLADDEGFQSFIAYVRESGPQALEFMGQLVQAVAAIAEAAAPVGDVVLPILTKTLDLIGAIAKSDFGTPIFGTLAAMSALSTATKIWGAAAKTSAGQFIASQVAAEASVGKTRASLGSLAKTAGVVAGITLVTTAITELAAANDEMEASAKRAQDALERGDRAAARQNITDLEGQTDALEELAHTAATSDNVFESFKANFNPQVFRNNVEDLFGTSLIEKNRREIEGLTYWYDTLDTSSPYESLARLDPALAGNAEAFGRAAAAADDYANTLAEVEGLLSERSAWRDYQAAIDAAAESVEENGKAHRANTAAGRANLDTLDAIAERAHKVAESMSDAEKIDFLGGPARRRFLAAADAMNIPIGKARQLADDLGLLAKANPKPKVDLDTSTAKQREAEIRRLLRKLGLSRTDPEVGMMFGAFVQGDREVLRQLRILDASRATPSVSLSTAGFNAAVSGVRAALSGLNGTTAHTYVQVHRSGAGAVSAGVAAAGADGMTVPGRRTPYGDKVLAYIAPGEEVISNRYGQADRNRALLKAINANRLAGGGTVAEAMRMQAARPMRQSAPQVHISCGHGRSGGSTGPAVFNLYDSSGVLLGTMRGIAQEEVAANDLMSAEVERAG